MTLVLILQKDRLIRVDMPYHHRRYRRQKREPVGLAGRRGMGGRRHGLAIRGPFWLLVGSMCVDPGC